MVRPEQMWRSVHILGLEGCLRKEAPIWPARMQGRNHAHRILIADDDPTIRLLLRRLLEQKQPDWEVCGTRANGVEAIKKVEQLEPDVVVMDLGMPVMTGLQAAPLIAKTHPTLADAADQRSGGIEATCAGKPAAPGTGAQ